MKKSTKKFVAALFVLSFSLTPVGVAQAQVGTVVAGMTVGAVLDQLEASLNKLIAQAGYEARHTTLVAAQQALLLIDVFRNNYTDLLDRTVESLNQQQEQAFSKLNASIKQMDDAARNRLADAQTIAGIFDSAVARIGNNAPRVYRYSPSYVGSETNSQTVEMVVQGSLMAVKPPLLKLAGKTYKPSANTDQSITFSIPRADLGQAKAAITPVRGEIIVYDDNRFLGVLGSIVEKPYSVVIYVVPPRLGTYVLAASGRSDAKETRTARKPPVEGLFRVESGAYDDSSVCHAFEPTEMADGWRLDVNSFRWVTNYENHGAFNGFNGSNEQKGFACLSARPFGKYNRRLGWAGSKGVMQGHVEVTEYRKVRRDWNESIAKGDLVWGKDIAFNLPAPASSFLLKVFTIDGREIILDREDKRNWFDVIWSPNNRRVVVQPKSLAVAFQ